MEYFPIESQMATAITDCCFIVHDWAKKKGWWDEPRNKGELIALMHSELSEALEYLRAKPVPTCRNHGSFQEKRMNVAGEQVCPVCLEPMKMLPAMDDKLPDVTGEHAELADVVIRIFDYAGAFGIDLGEVIRRKHEFNITRPVKHGKAF